MKSDITQNLSSLLLFIYYFFQLRERHGGSGHGSRGDAIDELRNAFELVEKSCPGISDDLVTEVVMRLAGQSLSENECRTATNKLKGYDHNMQTSNNAHTNQASTQVQAGMHNEQMERVNVSNESNMRQYEKRNKSPIENDTEKEHRSNSPPSSQQPHRYSTQL